MLNDLAIAKLLTESFVPLGMDNGDNPTCTEEEKKFLVPLGGDASTEGMSVFTSDGRLLERGGGFTANKIHAMLGRTAQRFSKLHPITSLEAPAQSAAATPTGSDAPTTVTKSHPPVDLLRPPKDGLVLMVTWKAQIPDGTAVGNPAFGDHTAEFARSIGVDRFWVRADEAVTLAKGEVPASVLLRLQQFTVTPLWTRNMSFASSAKVQDGALTFICDGVSGKGFMRSEAGRVREFQLLLSGPAHRVDNFGFPASLAVVPRNTTVPLFALLELMDPASPLAQVPPHAARNKNYLR